MSAGVTTRLGEVAGWASGAAAFSATVPAAAAVPVSPPAAAVPGSAAPPPPEPLPPPHPESTRAAQNAIGVSLGPAGTCNAERTRVMLNPGEIKTM